MKHPLFEIFLAVILLIWPGIASAQGVLRVVVYGDSLVSGYQLQPEEAFPARLDYKLKESGYYYVQVSSIAVDSATDGLQRLPEVLAEHPDLVVLSVGTNDAMRGNAVDRIYRYAGSIAKQLASDQIYVVVLAAIPPPSMGDDYARSLDRAFRNIPSLARGVQVFLASQGIAGQPDLSLADGIHPNARGVEAMVNDAFPLIDAGLRWKLEVKRYQQQYHHSQGGGQDIMPAGKPPGTAE